jgi:hypothetical protein
MQARSFGRHPIESYQQVRRGAALLRKSLRQEPSIVLNDGLSGVMEGAPHLLALNRKQPRVWGSPTGHEQAESRFLSRRTRLALSAWCGAAPPSE